MSNIKIALVYSILGLLLVACSPETGAKNGDLVLTEVMQTVEARMTLATSVQPSTPSTATVTPSPTPSPTDTTTPATTPEPNTNPQPSSCDVAGFVRDVSISDGTEMLPGTSFVKTWELRNDGSCTWNSDYQLVFYSGNAMGGAAVQQFTTGTVAPGESIEISVDLIAPNVVGHFIGNWVLRNASGVNFGIGAYGSPFYVEINVVEAGDTYSPTPTFTSTEGMYFETDTPTPTLTLMVRPTNTPTPTPTPTATNGVYPYP